jgi:hypothetical protein
MDAQPTAELDSTEGEGSLRKILVSLLRTLRKEMTAKGMEDALTDDYEEESRESMRSRSFSNSR